MPIGSQIKARGHVCHSATRHVYVHQITGTGIRHRDNSMTHTEKTTQLMAILLGLYTIVYTMSKDDLIAV